MVSILAGKDPAHISGRWVDAQGLLENHLNAPKLLPNLMADRHAIKGYEPQIVDGDGLLRSLYVSFKVSFTVI